MRPPEVHRIDEARFAFSLCGIKRDGVRFEEGDLMTRDDAACTCNGCLARMAATVLRSVASVCRTCCGTGKLSIGAECSHCGGRGVLSTAP